MPKYLNFKISSALKDIVGRELITDEYVAIFELVKNSYDAHASKVSITFENINSENSRIIISDNGKGMDLNDLKNKWLFLAYSAKKEGEEDKDIDYRNRIYSNKPFAGSKGIGRFSCDKLGKNLYLETKKVGRNTKTFYVKTDWKEFEKNSKREFKAIDIELDEINNGHYLEGHGTVLVISNLRSKWDRKKLLKLKDSLSKLINPYKSREKTKFSIILNVADELEDDKKEKEDREKVNGEVRNFIFETLGLKTTRIVSAIKGKETPVITELMDGGTKIYKIKEANKLSLKSNIVITLYYLNRSAKLTFSRQMGLASRRYGNVFLYKNGFRVYPYGEPFEDPMGIDSRKSRKTRSRLGTGEIIGRIEISEPENNEFKEASSRGDGLIKNENYEQLTTFFFSVLEKLETYVVDVQEWGLSIEDINNISISSNITDLVSTITNSEDILDFEVPDNFFEILEVSQSESAESVINNLNKIAKEFENDKLFEIVDKAKIKLKSLKKAREQAEKDADKALKLADEATEKLKSKITENLFLKSINTSDYQEMISLIHHVGIYAGTIENTLKHISLRVQNKIPLSNKELYDIIKQISLDVKKILSISNFATKARFNLETETTTIDIVNYIKEYVENILPGITDKGMNIKFIDTTKSPFSIKTRPIELSIIIENLVSNAKKAESRNLIIRTKRDSNKLIMEFEDDGIGINPSIEDQIYNIGFTTTDGSGVGLYHVKELIKRMGGNISLSNNSGKGVTFKIILREKT